VDSGYFCYAISYDPVQFELSQGDWAVVLHLNTVRSYRGNFALRGFLEEHLPPALPNGFSLQKHPRFFRITHEFDFDGPPADLPGVALEPMVTLFRTTHPALDRLFREIELADQDRTQPLHSSDGGVDRSTAANPDRPGPKGILNRAIPAAVRSRVLKTHGRICHLCGKPIESEADLHIDHVIPWAQGGTTHDENLRPAHRRCNLLKGAGDKVLPPEQRSPPKVRPEWRKIRRGFPVLLRSVNFHEGRGRLTQSCDSSAVAASSIWRGVNRCLRSFQA
jgi:hypothetical protein